VKVGRCICTVLFWPVLMLYYRRCYVISISVLGDVIHKLIHKLIHKIMNLIQNFCADLESESFAVPYLYYIMLCYAMLHQAIQYNTIQYSKVLRIIYAFHCHFIPSITKTRKTLYTNFLNPRNSHRTYSTVLFVLSYTRIISISSQYNPLSFLYLIPYNENKYTHTHTHIYIYIHTYYKINDKKKIPPKNPIFLLFQRISKFKIQNSIKDLFCPKSPHKKRIGLVWVIYQISLQKYNRRVPPSLAVGESKW
jgi:hypothetical protein